MESKPLSVRRQVLVLAVLGVILRLVLVDVPLISANGWIRQTQTADAARSYLEHGVWPLSAETSWRGDLGAQLLLELPLYNYASAALGFVLGNLTMAGRLVSMLLWLASFLLLQKIWDRLLREPERLWANVLVTLAPLSIAYGQAFSPEMLVFFLSVCIVLRTLIYDERPSRMNLLWVWVFGMTALCVKLPGVSHLYLLFGFVLYRQHGWGAALMPRNWAFAVATVAGIKGWAAYLDVVNISHYAFCTASENAKNFLKGIEGLLRPQGYARVVGYWSILLLGPLGLWAFVCGLWALMKKRKSGNRDFVLAWSGSILIFYLIWGPRTAFTHAYYNLTALACMAAVVGIGGALIASSVRGWRLPAKPLLALAAGLQVVTIAFGSWYLLRLDWTPALAADWLRKHTHKSDLILVKANHRSHCVHYFHLPTVFYHAQRKGWNWTRNMPEEDFRRAKSKVQWLVELKRPKELTPIDKLRAHFQTYVPPTPITELEEYFDLEPVVEEEKFRVFRVTPIAESESQSNE